MTILDSTWISEAHKIHSPFYLKLVIDILTYIYLLNDSSVKSPGIRGCLAHLNTNRIVLEMKEKFKTHFVTEIIWTS